MDHTVENKHFPGVFEAHLDLVLFGGGFCCPKVHGKIISNINLTQKGKFEIRVFLKG